MRTWFLPPPYTADDIEWIINSELEYDLETPYSAGDSGWCDYNTGHQIITNNHKIHLHTFDDKEEMWLLLKYDGRVQLRYCSLTEEELKEVDF